MTVGLLLAALAHASPDDDVRLELERTRAELSQLRGELAELRREPAQASGAEYTSYTGDVMVPAGETAAEAVSFAGDVRVDGHVTGDATAFRGDVVVGPEAVIEGDVTSFGGQVVVEQGGVILGNRVAMGTALPELSEPTGGGWFDGLYRRMVLVLSFAGAGVLTVGVFPKRVTAVARALARRPVHSAFVGSLTTTFLLLFSALFSVLTLGLGLPVAMVLVGGLGVAWLLGFMGLCQAVGDNLPFEQRPHGRWVAFLVGVALVSSVSALPWIGWAVIVGAGLVGIGAALSTRFGAQAA